MNITVHYMAQLKRAAGMASERVEIERPCSVRDFVRQLAQRHDLAFRRILLDADGSLNATNLFFIGDTQVAHLDQVELHDGAVITVLSPIAGG